MLRRLYILLVSCLIALVGSDASCGGWPHHKNFHLIHSDDDCGKVKINQQFSSRILNGKTVPRGGLPWMAYLSIRYDNRMRACGGSIINDKYILTSSHCLSTPGIDPAITVILGLHNRTDENDRVAESYGVEEYVFHPSFDHHSGSACGDIALIRLNRSISFESPYINYICLPTSCELASKDFLGEKLTAAGWGKISYGQIASVLQKVLLPIKKCTKFYLKGSLVSPSWSLLCAGSGNAMTCGGDSGGPLMYEADGRFVQVGVSTTGPNTDCTLTLDDTVKSSFSRVTSFISWILENIKP